MRELGGSQSLGKWKIGQLLSSVCPSYADCCTELVTTLPTISAMSWFPQMVECYFPAIQANELLRDLGHIIVNEMKAVKKY